MSEQEQETEGTPLEQELAGQMSPDVDDAGDERELDDQAQTDEQVEPEPVDDSYALSEEIGKKLDGLQKHVAKRLGEILGDQVQVLEECEVCSFTNTPGWRAKGPYPDPVEQAVRMVLGMRGPADYKPDNYSHVCEACVGLGETVTGSKVLGQETLPCIDCKARGWVPVGPERAGPTYGSGNGQTPAFGPSPIDAAAILPPGEPDPPEVDALKALGYTVIRPFVPTS